MSDEDQSPTVETFTPVTIEASIRARVRIFDTDFVELYDSLADGRSVESFLAIEYPDAPAENGWFPVVVDYAHGYRWSGRIEAGTGAAFWTPESAYLKAVQSWPNPFDDDALHRNTTAWMRRFGVSFEQIRTAFDGIRPTVDALTEAAKPKHKPPMWAVDPARSKRPKRNGSQPRRQAVR